MTVGEWIAELQKLDPDMPVVTYRKPDFELAEMEVSYGLNIVLKESEPTWWFAPEAPKEHVVSAETPNAVSLLWVY